MTDRASPLISAPAPSVPDLQRYSLGDELGRGASATVYDAIDRVLSRHVALKVLREASAARFLAEAQITSQLEHPYIVPVHDYGILPDGRPFLVMKRVRGRTLRKALDASDLGPLLRRLRLFQQVVEAVAFAHRRGLTHRDLKPENIMIDEHGHALVMDWGLVRATQTTTEVTLPARPQTLEGALLGTPGYLPPESYGHTAAPAAQDVFALGVLLWEVLLGSWPWTGATMLELAFEAGRAPRPPDDVDPDLREIIARCLRRAPEARFASAQDLLDALREVTEGTARKARAAIHVREAGMLLQQLIEAEDAARAARDRVRELEDALPGWRPLEERLPLHQAREEAESLGIRASELFGSLVGAAERALSQDPGSAEAKAVLEQAWWRRFAQAERDRDRSEMALVRQRLIGLGGAAMEARLHAPGALTLSTDPAGAEVWCQRVLQTGLVWGRGEPVLLGHTPLREVELAQGSYQLMIRAPGKRDTPYPVLIERGALHDVRQPVRLLTDEETGGDAWIYVPGGWTWVGGDPEVRTQLPHQRTWVDGFLMSKLPVSVAEYQAFIRLVAERDPDEALRRVPRREEGKSELGIPYFELRDSGWTAPERDADGDRWFADQPVHSISCVDAETYCIEMSTEKRALSLPGEAQWERAARGADGRWFPWGNQFDPGLAFMANSSADKRIPRMSKLSTNPAWCGARLMAGTVREWVRGLHGEAYVKGGSWNGTAKLCRAANRFPRDPWSTRPYVGFRPLQLL